MEQQEAEKLRLEKIKEEEDRVKVAQDCAQEKASVQKEYVAKEDRVEVSVNEDLASALSEVDYFLAGATSAATQSSFSPPARVDESNAGGSGSGQGVPHCEQSAVSEEEVLFQADPASSPPSPGGAAASSGSRKGSPEKRQSTIL